MRSMRDLETSDNVTCISETDNVSVERYVPFGVEGFTKRGENYDKPRSPTEFWTVD